MATSLETPGAVRPAVTGSHVNRREIIALAGLAADRRHARAARRRAIGTADLGRSHLAGADLVRPGRDAGDHHALHGDVRVARRAGEADARPADGRRASPRSWSASEDALVYDFVAAPTASNSTTASRSPPRTSSSRSSAIAAPRTI